MMGRSIKVETNLRCDFCHHIIPVGKFGTQVSDGEAQGMYHGRNCYEAAKKHMQEVKKEQGGDE